MNNDLISREALKTAIKNSFKHNFHGYDALLISEIDEFIDNAPTIKTFTLADIEEQYRKGLEKGLSEWETERPQGEWFDCISEGTLKARHGDYVLYKVDFLLDNLTREVYIMEGARRMRGKEE